jgi:signal transduction histidine kinase
LRQAVRALTLILDNARKFTKEGRVCLRLEKVGHKIRFIVEDTGIGVPVADAERIFGEFVQLDAYYEGTGIGLTVARSIARRLGGDIVLDTSYQPGARFVMTLPI